jgi:hypothetical protein
LVSGLVNSGLMLRLVSRVDVVQPVSPSVRTQRVDPRQSQERLARKKQLRKLALRKSSGQQQHQERNANETGT